MRPFQRAVTASTRPSGASPSTTRLRCRRCAVVLVVNVGQCRTSPTRCTLSAAWPYTAPTGTTSSAPACGAATAVSICLSTQRRGSIHGLHSARPSRCVGKPRVQAIADFRWQLANVPQPDAVRLPQRYRTSCALRLCVRSLNGTFAQPIPHHALCGFATLREIADLKPGP